MKRIWTMAAFYLGLAMTGLAAQNPHPLTFDDMIACRRLDAADLSPDGRWVAYNVRDYSLQTNTYVSHLFITSVDGATTRQLTFASARDMMPVWSPDGKSLAFVSNRGGLFQLYTLALEGGEARQVTRVSTEVSFGNGLAWSPDGKTILFTCDVYPECPDDDCNRKKESAKTDDAVKAQSFDKLPYRVWDSWKDGKRSQLLAADVATGATVDLIKGEYDVPPIDLGGSIDFAYARDGKSIAFTMNTDPNVAWSTNNDIFVMPAGGGDLKKISTSKGVDNQPIYSPDGTLLAFRSMKRAGYESDKTDLVIYDIGTGKITNLTEKLDRSVGDACWGPDGKSLYFDAEDHGRTIIYSVGLDGGAPKAVVQGSNDQLIGVTDNAIVVKRQSFTMPSELYAVDRDGKNVRPLTKLNAALMAGITLNPAEEFWFEGAAKVKVQGFLIKPPNFNPKKKYPMVYLVHGGPQGAWTDEWHYRWNAELFAAPGFVAVMVNPRGSTGYGQQFTDDINGDWGGKVYEDLMKGLDYVLANYSYIDKDRVGAAGGSFGGYMMNWFNGHTDRFKCLITHSGTMNEYNMYGGTEEQWFEEWEMGGPYWDNKAKSNYEKWSPYNYVQNWKTPMLVIHGQQDFRVPVIEGMNAFTALQRKGIASRFVYFPDEGHWILKPQNAKRWYQEVHAWLEHWLVPYEH